MPGILATFDPSGRPDLAARFERALRAAQPTPFAVVEAWHAPGGQAALGRVDLGVLENGPQPVTSPDGRYTLVMAGELRQPGEAAQRARAAGWPIVGEGHAALALAVWLGEGLKGLARLNGSWCLAIHDHLAGTLTVVMDRLGSRPHLYHWHEGRFYLAPESRAILAGRGSAPGLDRQGLCEFLALEYPLADRTLLEGVKTVPAGGVLTVGPAGVALGRYWLPQYDHDASRTPPAGFLDEAIERYRAAIARATPGPVGLALSGGTDSRLILALLDRKLPTYTFGEAASEDVTIASACAAAAGVPHTVIPLSPDFMACNVEAILTWGDGMVSLFHGHNGDQLERKRAVAPIVLRGMTAEYCRLDAVEAILAEPARSKPHQLALWARRLAEGRLPISDFADEAALARRLTSKIWTAMTPALAVELLSPELAAEMARRVPAGVAEALAAIAAPTLEDRLALFNVRHRQTRFSPWGLKTAGSVIECRKPLDDYELLEFLLGCPPWWRRKLQDQVLCRVAPHLAAIPRTGAGAPVSAGMARRAAAFAAKQAKQRLAPGRVQSFASPQANLRGPARDYWEALLLDASTLGNGFVRPEGLRATLEAHLDGRVDAATVLCLIGTLELWRRATFGGSAQAGHAA